MTGSSSRRARGISRRWGGAACRRWGYRRQAADVGPDLLAGPWGVTGTAWSVGWPCSVVSWRCRELGLALRRLLAVHHAAASLLLTVELGRAVTRYGARHYRVLHIDGSIATQDLYLVSTALDLACCAVAGFAEAPPCSVARDQAARPAVPDRMAPLITGWLLGHRSESCRGTGC
jgi:hypothetical protein